MTVLGKILVIVNLVFSLVVGALIIMVYVARTNWALEYNKLTTSYEAAKASAVLARDESNQAKAAFEDRLNKKQGELDTALATVQKETKARQDAEAALLLEKGTGVKAGINAETSKSEISRRVDEVKILDERIASLQKDNGELQKEKADLRDAKVAAEIERDSLKARNAALVEQVATLARQIEKGKAIVTSSGAGTTPGVRKNPPQENIEGLVKTTDPSGLITLTIGSDAGLKAGNTLEAFRLGASPKYLGTVRIIEVRETEAVARPETSPGGRLQKGDRVASKILGS